MHQYIKFTGCMYVDADGLDWDKATRLIKTGLTYGEKHQGWSLVLDKVVEIGLDEEDD